MNAITNMARLTRAGAIIAWSGARVLPDEVRLPPPLRLFRRMTAPLRQEKANCTANEGANEAKLSTALTSLGPSYIKLGQFLATRDDIIGRELAADLATLQDRLPPFSQDEARRAVEDALAAPIDTLFAELGPPVAAASIAPWVCRQQGQALIQFSSMAGSWPPCGRAKVPPVACSQPRAAVSSGTRAPARARRAA